MATSLSEQVSEAQMSWREGRLGRDLPGEILCWHELTAPGKALTLNCTEPDSVPCVPFTMASSQPSG